MPIDWEEFEKEIGECILECASPVPDLVSAENLMIRLIQDRLCDKDKDNSKDLRFPVVLFIVRGDRGGKANTIAEEAIASIKYWDLSSGKNIDILFPGWDRQHDRVVFDVTKFYEFQEELQSSSKWKYGGESEILLLNFDYRPSTSEGRFSFKESVSLSIEEMIKKEIASSVDALMHEIVSISKSVDKPNVWEISDQFAIQRARKSIWNYLKNKITGGLSEVYDELRPFAVCNLEKSSNRRVN
jgi:hypothetical protein